MCAESSKKTCSTLSESGSAHTSQSEGCSDGETTTTSSLDLFTSSGDRNAVSKLNSCSDFMNSGYKENSTILGQESETKSVEPAQNTHSVGKENEIDGNHESGSNKCCQNEKLVTRTFRVGCGVHYSVGKRCRLAAQSSEQYPIEFSMCKWSPDGKMLLAGGLSSCTHLYHLPAELETGIPRKVVQLTNVRKIHHGEPLWDACWVPCSPKLFASCCQDHPVQMWDSSTSNVIATYTIYHRRIKEKVVSPHCITFSEDGRSLYCGLDGHLKVFATERPGASGQIWRISGNTPPSPLSSIALCSPLLALGFQTSICLCSELNSGTLQLTGLPGRGVTQMAFSTDGVKLFCSYMMVDLLHCWDLRQPSRPMFSIVRSASTRHRVYFDFLSNYCYLASGGTAGLVSIWDLRKQLQSKATNPYQCFQAHTTPALGCSTNPAYPLLATVSRANDFINRHEEEHVVKLWSTLGHGAGAYQDMIS